MNDEKNIIKASCYEHIFSNHKLTLTIIVYTADIECHLLPTGYWTWGNLQYVHTLTSQIILQSVCKIATIIILHTP